MSVEQRDFAHAVGLLEDFREQTETLSGMMAYTNFFANLSIEGSSELVVGEIVSDNYFSLLGVQPTVGRAFVQEEFAALGASPVAVLSYPFWQTRFGGDRGVIDSIIYLDNLPVQVVGIMPPGFQLLMPGGGNAEPDLFEALRVDTANSPRTNVFMNVIGRIKPLAEPWTYERKHVIDMTPWRLAIPTAFTLLSAVVAVYLIFSPLGLVAGPTPLFYASMAAVVVLNLLIWGRALRTAQKVSPVRS